ncbi:MAG: BON domain-containing protein [Betaproteobacteria bacterium]|nr:BON domain-containing protein [Betaproteobacteria bacterium]
MNTNSRLGRILPATGATLFLLAMGSMRAQAAGLQGETEASPATVTQPEAPPERAAAHRAAKLVDDSVITAKVKTVLFRDEALKSLKIHVETRKGVVRLSGDVDNASEAARAVREAQAVKGVKLVMSDLRVRG